MRMLVDMLWALKVAVCTPWYEICLTIMGPLQTATAWPMQ